MSEPTLSVHAQVDDAAVRQAMGLMLSRIENPRAALDDVGGEWVERTYHRFDVGGYPERWKKRRDGSASHLTGRGGLKNSIHTRTSRRSVTIGSRHQSAVTHQLGAEGAHAIKPRHRKFLSIPLQKGRSYQAGAGVWFRRYPGQVFSLFKTPDHGVVMFRPKGARRARPIFVLLKRVEIPARPFLLATREDMDEFAVILADWAEGRRS